MADYPPKLESLRQNLFIVWQQNWRIISKVWDICDKTLFPNQYDNDNRISANTPLHLSSSKWQIRANGPAGKDRFVAIVSGTANRFAGLGVPVTPFKKIMGDTAGARELIKRLVTPDKSCKPSKSDQRDFDAMPTCSSGYGAGYTDVQETN
ncbi:DUF4384 domain-containing protein [Methylovulum psychrotolerans]|uniref:DUF4384 domain-containing protein n=1 Tax=Methylovulum psychrotolerans TaxID=1704499 RepID=UPI00147386C8|nr:DUF4384 domain-containing protein [Methylovulum psychrotolerans]